MKKKHIIEKKTEHGIITATCIANFLAELGDWKGEEALQIFTEILLSILTEKQTEILFLELADTLAMATL